MDSFLGTLIVYICIIPATFILGGLGIKKVLEVVGALKTEDMYVEVPQVLYTEDVVSAGIEAYQRTLPTGASRVNQKLVLMWDTKVPRAYAERRYREEIEEYGASVNVFIKEF